MLQQQWQRNYICSCHSRITNLKTFSVNAIAELLERDRATVVRALREVPADVKERGQPRWRMATAVAALERHHQADDDDATDPALTAAYKKLDTAIAAMQAAASLERRRCMAINTVKPLLATTDRMIRAAGRAAGHDEELVALRADHLGTVMLREFERPCEWSFEEALKIIGI
jgi:hypothetical protein